MDKYNTFGKRLLAGLIDGLIFLPFSFTDLIALQNKYYFICISLIYIALWSAYTLVLHNLYGQTFGKKIMGVKVYNINEQNLMSFKTSFFRESIWITGQLIILIFFSSRIYSTGLNEDIFNDYNNSASIFTLVWIMIELFSMLSNKKRRSVQDYIANSVVIKIKD